MREDNQVTTASHQYHQQQRHSKTSHLVHPSPSIHVSNLTGLQATFIDMEMGASVSYRGYISIASPILLSTFFIVFERTVRTEYLLLPMQNICVHSPKKKAGSAKRVSLTWATPSTGNHYDRKLLLQGHALTLGKILLASLTDPVHTTKIKVHNVAMATISASGASPRS